MRKIVRIAGILLVMGVVYFSWYKWNLRPVDSGDQTNTVVDVPTGSSVKQIAVKLEEEGIIRSSSAFSTFVRWSGLQGSLKAGSFLLRPSMTAKEVVDILTSGVSQEMILTIPEGFTVADIDRLLADKKMTQPGEIIACAKTCDFSFYTFLPKMGPALSEAPGGRVEGYLFPDTYFVLREGLTAEKLIRRLLDTFQKRVVEGLASDIKSSEYSLQEIMAMASLVEEETRANEERPMVAGILWKRFDVGMKLDVDAAVRYLLGKKTQAITSADLQTDSPYNLRKVKGLPPTPIANPGLQSITATLRPVDSEYWFYLHGNDGAIRYAETNDEHNENRAKYLR